MHTLELSAVSSTGHSLCSCNHKARSEGSSSSSSSTEGWGSVCVTFCICWHMTKMFSLTNLTPVCFRSLLEVRVIIWPDERSQMSSSPLSVWMCNGSGLTNHLTSPSFHRKTRALNDWFPVWLTALFVTKLETPSTHSASKPRGFKHPWLSLDPHVCACLLIESPGRRILNTCSYDLLENK